MKGVKGSASVSLQLSRQLTKLRKDAGLSQHEMAGRLGWSQSKVCRLERAQRGADINDVNAWLAATGADEATRRQVRDYHLHSGFFGAILLHFTRDATRELNSLLATAPIGTKPD